MPEKFKVGCQRPQSKIIETADVSVPVEEERKVSNMLQVGKPAPDFELSAYHKGEFLSYKLSEFKGQWVVLCFYPGDFTFV